MKNFAYIALVLMALVVVSNTDAHEGEWFDLEGCSICKHLAAEEGLLEAMTWETHLISNGALSATAIPADYRDAMGRVEKNIEATVAEMQSGKQAKLCGFCTSFGGLMQAGMTPEKIETEFGQIELMTSDDPELVKQIQEHAKKTIAAYKEMKSGEHHSHDGDHH